MGRMTENTKDTLTIWGLVFIAILAIGYAFDHFGNIAGYLTLLPIVLLGRRVILWLEDLRYFRGLEEDRLRHNQEELKSP